VGLAISAAGFLLIAGGFIANYLQLRLNTAQAEKLAKSVRINVGDAVTSHVTKLDQVFMNDPWLMPYFYEGKEISKTDKDYPKVSATAEMVLDVFDLVVSQNKNFPEFWDAPEAWDNWVSDMFSSSPILREKIDKTPTWYGKDMKELRRRGGEKVKVTATSKPPA